MFEPVEEQYVVAAEQHLGVTFPGSYRAWLLACNGGEVEVDGEWWDLHPVADASDPRRIGPTWDHVCRQTDLARLLGGFPAAAISIGEDGSGDRLVLMRPEPEMPLQLGIWQHASGEVAWTCAALDRAFARP